MFKCDCCGLCCMNLNNSPLYDDLNRGDGICKYLDCNTMLCTIYNSRSLKCCVDKAYEVWFKNTMTKQEYYELNYEACRRLKEERKIKNVPYNAE